MVAHERTRDTGKGRVKRLYDRLASILRRLPPERRTAFAEYLDEQAEAEAETSPDGRRVTEGGTR